MSLLDQLTQQFSGAALEGLSKQLGADQGQLSGAISAALPMIVGAMAKNASTDEGASALDNALGKDHDGSILDNLAGFLGSSDNGSGSGILGHVFGGKRQEVESGLSEMSGLAPNISGQLLENLAPVVMGYLGRQKASQGLDAASIAGMLLGARSQNQGSPAMSMLNSLLDRDGDGSALDDIGGMLGNLFGGKK